MNKLFPFVFLSSVLLFATTESTFYKGVNAQSFQRNRPDLNGLIIRNPGNSMIFWVDRGQRRHIAGPSIYGRLFVPNQRDYLDTDAVEPGPSITNDNRLVRCGENGHPLKNRIYLLDQGTKRHVTSPTVMNKNNFNGKGVNTIDCPVLATIKDGDPIR